MPCRSIRIRPRVITALPSSRKIALQHRLNPGHPACVSQTCDLHATSRIEPWSRRSHNAKRTTFTRRKAEKIIVRAGYQSAPPATTTTTSAAATPSATTPTAAAALHGAALRTALLELPGPGTVIHTAECTAVAGGTRCRPLLRALHAPASARIPPVCIADACPTLPTRRPVLSRPGVGADIAPIWPVRTANAAALRAAGPVLPGPGAGADIRPIHRATGHGNVRPPHRVGWQTLEPRRRLHRPARRTR